MPEVSRNQQRISSELKGLPIDNDILFSDHKNVYKKRIERRQTKLFEKISFIKPFLQEGERIILVTTGCSPMSFIEQFLTGWIVYYLKRSLFIFTDKCIFHIPTKSDYSYRNSIAKISYADCQSIELKGRALVVKYKNGNKEKFYYIHSQERKKIKLLIKSTPFDGVPSKSAGRMHLCPRCREELIKDKYSCPNCHLEFKDSARGNKISIIYPGGGYFYTRHWIMGINDAIFEFVLLVLVIVAVIDAIRGEEGILGTLIILSVILVFEKLQSVYHLNHFVKEYIPIQKEIIPIKSF